MGNLDWFYITIVIVCVIGGLWAIHSELRKACALLQRQIFETGQNGEQLREVVSALHTLALNVDGFRADTSGDIYSLREAIGGDRMNSIVEVIAKLSKTIHEDLEMVCTDLSYIDSSIQRVETALAALDRSVDND